MGEIFKLFGTIGVDTSEAEQGIDNVTGKAKKSGKGIFGAFTSAAKGIGKIAAGIGVFKLLDGAVNLVKGSIQQAFGRIDTMEQFDRVMTTMLGSSEAAGKALDNVNDIVKGTAYGLDVAAKSTQRFVTGGMDIKLAEDTVKSWGDAVAFYGDGSNETFESVTDAIAQMNTSGKVDMQQMNRIISAGVPVWEILSAATGKSTETIQKEMQDGKFSAEDFTKTMNKALMEGVDGFDSIDGAAKEAGASWGAAFDNMRAAVARGVTSVIQKIDEMLTSNGLPDMREMVGMFGSFFEETLNKVAEAIGVLIGWFLNLYNSNSDTFNSIWQTISSVFEQVVEFLQNAWENIKTFWQQNGEAILQNAITIFESVWATVQTVFEAVQEIIQTVLNLVVPFIQEQLGKIKQFWDENGEQIMQAVQKAFSFIQSVIEFVMPAILFVIEMVWDNIKGVINGALDIIMGLIKTFSGLFTGDWSKMWEGIKQLLGGAVEFIWNLIQLTFMGKIVKGFGAFFKSVSSIFTNLGKSVTKIWTGLKNGVTKTTQALWNSVKSVFNTLRNGVSSIFTGVKNTASTVWNGIKNTISGVVNGIKNTVSNVFNSVKSSVSNVFNSIKSTVTRVWNGIRDAISKPIDKAREAVKTAIDKIKGLFNFEFKWPKLKMPKFSISGSMNPVKWIKEGVPKLSVNWNAAGGIFSKATIFNTSNAGLQGVGEAGPEAILPLNRETLGGIGEGIAATMDLSNIQTMQGFSTIIALLHELIQAVKENRDVYIDGEKMTGKMDDINAIKAIIGGYMDD